MKFIGILMVLAFVSASETAFSKTASENVEAALPYVRLLPPTQKTTGAFLLLQNKGSKAHALVKVEGQIAASIELHNHITEKGMMKMVEVKKIEIPAGGKVELRPGGYHVMLIDLKRELKEKELVPLTLVFEDGSKKDIKAVVKSLDQEHGHHH